MKNPNWKYMSSTIVLPKVCTGLSKRCYRLVTWGRVYGTLFGVTWHKYGDYRAPELHWYRDVYNTEGE